MGKSLPFLFYFLISASFCFAQWSWKNPLPQGNALYGVHFVDDNTGWAVGNKGTIIKTTDGGMTWHIQISNTNAEIRAIQFINANIGYAVGDSGLVVKTTNGGDNWIKLNCGYNYWISSLYFINESTGWLGAGNNIIKTTNGGSSWQSYVQFAPFSIHSVHFLSQTVGFWVGFGGINKTTDGGASFSSNSSGVPYSYDWDDVCFINNNVGWIVGEDGRVIKTNDGGNNWTQMSSVSGTYDRIFFKDDNNGWIASGWNGLYRTQDGGNSWILTSIRNIYDVFFTTNVGFAVGAGGKIYKTTDLGVSWHPSYYNLMPNKKFSKICFNDPEVGFAVGDSGKIFKTTDGGASWITKTSPSNTNFSSVFFTDVNTGWVSGYQVILKTTDSGNSWKLKYTSNYENINDLFFFNSQLGWAVGDKLRKTTNGGNEWIQQTLPNVGGDYYLQGIYFVDPEKGFTIGPSGWCYKTVNGGANWNKVTLPTSVGLNEVKFYNTSIGWIVGESGTILKTTDGGGNWDIQNFGQDYSLFGLCIIDSLNLWAVGGVSNSDYESVTLLSTNGGEVWINIDNPNTQCLYGCYFIDKNNGWAAGELGSLLNFDGNLQIPNAPSELIATSLNDRIKLEWTDNSSNEEGFEIFRSENLSGNYKKLFEVSSNITEYIDSSISVLSAFWYRIRAYNTYGASALCREDSTQTFVISSTGQHVNNIVENYQLVQNYPNPFNPTTTIGFRIPEKGSVRLSVLNILGEEIKILLNEEKEAGFHSIDFNAVDLPSGVYLYRLRAGDFIETKKMILIR